MSESPYADYHWLIGAEADHWLQRVSGETDKSLVALTKLLRRDLSASRSHLVLQQVELRRRATVKFSQAAKMFFTGKSLEQATDEAIAGYKAERFHESCVADLCCGIGGDGLSLAKESEVLGIDSDPIVALFAQTNADRSGRRLRVQCREVGEMDLHGGLFHIDPDRRPSERRTTEISAYQPGPDFVSQLHTQSCGTAIKVAPAAQLPAEWRGTVEREWLATRGECRQQVWWTGELSQNSQQNRATRLLTDSRGEMQVDYSFAGQPALEIAPTATVGQYIFEPSAEILAADLSGALALDLELAQPFAGIPYLTSSRPHNHSALQSFEVIEVLPFDRKRVRQALRTRGLGRIEVKKRGTRQEPAAIQRFLRNEGPDQATVLLAGVAQHVTAVIARRCES